MPRTITIEKTVFAFNELSDRAKDAAREWWRNGESQDFDSEYIFDNAVTCGKLMGIEISTKSVKRMGGGTREQPVIYWSGFSSQGDGACFEGHYQYEKGSARAIRKHAPQDSELHGLADTLQKIQSRHSYKIGARMKHSGHYQHSGCMQVEVECDGRDVTQIVDDEIAQCMRDFADWIYRNLEREYEYRMSDENVDESIRCNEYEFTEEGKIA